MRPLFFVAVLMCYEKRNAVATTVSQRNAYRPNACLT